VALPDFSTRSRSAILMLLLAGPGRSSVNMMTEIGRLIDHSVAIHHDCNKHPAINDNLSTSQTHFSLFPVLFLVHASRCGSGAPPHGVHL
jgi:hypothetical protein